MSSDGRRVVIVGAGHAGGSVAAFLRQMRFAGQIDLIGEETVGPYHRPPLSKKFSLDEAEQPLKPAEHYAEQAIGLRTSTCVRALDLARRMVICEDGTELDYDALVLATGSINRRLTVSGAELKGVHQLRTIDDARALKAATTPGRRMVIVGGGYIGLEVAAAAGREGIAVTVLEREAGILPRVGSPALSDFLARRHGRMGTEIHTGAQVAALEDGGTGAVGAVVLADGRRVPCDCVLIGIGAVANDALARGADLACEGGIVVDEHGATSAEHVWAAGDVTRRPVAGYDGRHRLESIPSAVEQSRQVAAAIAGGPPPKAEVPWFWSDQFDLKLQICGLLGEEDAVTVRGDPEEGRFALFHTAGRRLVAVEAVNSARDFMAGKTLIRDGTHLDLDRLGDAAFSLKEVLAV
ncbi:MAG TPA: FAD-dependent oxidoreductase [Solirubrobacteraceae bacterium]|jgi:3-phenylpropionate/trans-cinnamate dioxygenase ferredoxin reductase subunit